MDDLDLLIDLHRTAERQGPGSDEATRQALALSGLRGQRALRVADIGCGTGAATRVLAQDLDAQVMAVDVLPQFLEVLKAKAENAGLSNRIETLTASMDDLPFAHDSLDAIWSEGAIYNIGFEAGIKAWRPLLKPGGVLAVSELTWLTKTRPQELTDHWTQEYPQVATAAEKIAQLQAAGYVPVGYFPLGHDCWMEHYYSPMRARFSAFLAQHDTKAAQALVAAERCEIDLYERHSDYVSYGFYIARRLPD
ncbi:class I SAM-dependent methyltransferase [Lutimaribacter sp. EGI FJ00015]|uniref:Class I SAM-dependent methyltransferase n=1 Tax=Lutimaribacter degradans TaxID=2945989 RepID=A0ACC5ZTY1_9RHOB|nr:class I SAM-dependent methyltransferase [Lutimaribacter sp. EGI FJ00013]MCM2561799.1 class I SAM-dependent methyltransferase [Lutimaribacter sp. EGI FJ00013]MCO0613168.1 class I SAM-dependent methyltransferase [Lutimaribacter sp. EGI FJ00015]MCO0635632.1 class I SAM-dependent methyltransferase [Lutimaribacter sp. EGI FJ00014]